MARVVEYYVEGERREWKRGWNGRVDGVGEGGSGREERVVEGKGVEALVGVEEYVGVGEERGKR